MNTLLFFFESDSFEHFCDFVIRAGHMQDKKLAAMMFKMQMHKMRLKMHKPGSGLRRAAHRAAADPCGRSRLRSPSGPRRYRVRVRRRSRRRRRRRRGARRLSSLASTQLPSPMASSTGRMSSCRHCIRSLSSRRGRRRSSSTSGRTQSGTVSKKQKRNAFLRFILILILFMYVACACTVLSAIRHSMRQKSVSVGAAFFCASSFLCLFFVCIDFVPLFLFGNNTQASFQQLAEDWSTPRMGGRSRTGCRRRSRCNDHDRLANFANDQSIFHVLVFLFFKATYRYKESHK